MAENPTHHLMRRSPADTPEKVRRVKVGEEGHLYFGDHDAKDPCHYCHAPYGKPHLEDAECDHEQCPLCGGQLLMCECELAVHVLVQKAKLPGTGATRTFRAEGFTEAEAQKAADAEWRRLALGSSRRYIKKTQENRDRLADRKPQTELHAAAVERSDKNIAAIKEWVGREFGEEAVAEVTPS